MEKEGLIHGQTKSSPVLSPADDSTWSHLRMIPQRSRSRTPNAVLVGRV